MPHHGRPCRVYVWRGHSLRQPIMLRLLIRAHHLCLVGFQQPLLGLVVDGHVSGLSHHPVVEIASYLLYPHLSLLALRAHQALSEGLSDLPQVSPCLDLPRHLIQLRLISQMQLPRDAFLTFLRVSRRYVIGLMGETEGVFLGLMPIVEVFREFDQHLIGGTLNELVWNQVLLVQVLGILDFGIVPFVVFKT